MANILMAIQPYWHKDMWVVDDASKGLKQEPLVGDRTDEIVSVLGSPVVDHIIKDIPNAHSGFILLFSALPFCGYQVELTRAEVSAGKHTYKTKDSKAYISTPLLCGYFETEPELLYVKAEPCREYDPIEMVALQDRIEKLEQLVGKLTLENELLKRGKET